MHVIPKTWHATYMKHSLCHHNWCIDKYHMKEKSIPLDQLNNSKKIMKVFTNKKITSLINKTSLEQF